METTDLGRSTLIACTLPREEAEKLAKKANEAPLFVTEDIRATLEEPLLFNQGTHLTVVVESNTEEKTLIAKGYVLALLEG